MKKLSILIIFLITFSVIFAQESIAVSLKVKGEVDLTRQEQISRLETGADLYNQDQIESKEGSFAAIKFVDGSTIVRLFPLSVLTISANAEAGKLNKRSKLDLGEIWSRVDTGSGGFEVETPTTVVSVKGTQFILKVSEDGSSTLYTVTGKVEMQNKGDDGSVLVSEGEKAYSDGTGAIEVVPFEEEEIEEFVETDETEKQTLEIQLENDEGDQKTISIELE